MIRYILYVALVLFVWLIFNHWIHWKPLLYSVVIVFSLGLIARFFGYRILTASFKLINRFVFWARLPRLLAVLNLDIFRMELRNKNLFDTQKNRDLPPAIWSPDVSHARTANGTFNDLNEPDMGRAGAHFGRNFSLENCYPDIDNLMNPNPREISRKLMVRSEFVPATTLNLLAAAWIQFQVHGWVNHERNENEFHEIPIDKQDSWPQEQSPMRIAKTKVGSASSEIFPPAYVNTETHWWDQSQLYGTNREAQLALRTQKQGKLKIQEHQLNNETDYRLEPNPDPELASIDHTGFFDNY